MGASASTNVSKVAINSIVKVASDIVQNTSVTTNSSQIISVTHNKGNVDISGNKLRQKATVNMKALFNAMSSEEAQQKLALEVAQQAKAITSGLNLAQFSVSTNILDTFISATIDLSSKIAQSCTLNSNQNQSIIVEYVDGNTTITNNVLEQVSDLLQNCVSNSVNSSKAIQDVAVKLSQTASASAIGISEWALALMGALLLGIPVVGIVIGGVYAMKYIFPLMTICGICIIVYYIYSVKNIMKYTSFSSLIEYSPNCLAEKLATHEVTSAKQAADMCENNINCTAVDFKAFTVSSGGEYIPLQRPVAELYSKISCDDVKPDEASLVKTPNLELKLGEPSLHDEDNIYPNGTVYVDMDTTNWYQKHNNVWNFKSKLIMNNKSPLVVSRVHPSNSRHRGSHYIYISENMAYWHIYKWDPTNNRWIEDMKKPGPGMYTSVPSSSNTTAFKKQERNQLILYIGIAFTLLGIIGTIYSYLKTKSSDQNNINKYDNQSKRV